MPMDEFDFLGQIAQLRFPEPTVRPARTLLYSDMSSFRKALVREGRAALSEAAIRSWFVTSRRASLPKRQHATQFLSNYLGWIVTKHHIIEPDRIDRIRALQHMLSSVASVSDISNIAGDTSARPAHVILDGANGIFDITLKSLLSISNQIKKTETDYLFHGSEIGESQKEHSYFIVYRYSTNNGAFVKTFLVVKKHKASALRQLTFTHFMWSGTELEFKRHVFRECEGVVLKFDKSMYFMGYNYTVPRNKRNSPNEYERVRGKAKWAPTGIGVLAVEYESVEENPDLFSALTMTLAADGQPVLARVAMLYLGTRRTVGIELTDFIIQPTEDYASAIETDLNATISRIYRAGGRCSDLIHSRYNQSAKVLSPDVAKRLGLLLDNTPAWTKKSNPGRKRASEGAIESFSDGKSSRPRD